MPDGGFSVDLSALEHHEQELRLLLDKMPDAAAELSSQWRPDVYGLVGEFLASGLDHWNNSAVQFVRDTRGAGDHLADQLQAIREQYEAGDTGVAQTIKEIHTTLDAHVPPAGGQEAEA